jgi:hypothetical protein
VALTDLEELNLTFADEDELQTDRNCFLGVDYKPTLPPLTQGFAQGRLVSAATV